MNPQIIALIVVAIVVLVVIVVLLGKKKNTQPPLILAPNRASPPAPVIRSSIAPSPIPKQGVSNIVTVGTSYIKESTQAPAPVKSMAPSMPQPSIVVASAPTIAPTMTMAPTPVSTLLRPSVQTIAPPPLIITTTPIVATLPPPSITPVLSTSMTNLIMTHPNGSSVTYDSSNNTLRLGGGFKPMTLDVFNDVNVYNSSKKRVGLKYSGTTLYVRHTGLTLKVYPFVANNFDFAWHFIYANGVNSNDGYKIYNDYDPASKHYIGYDAKLNEVRIVPQNDTRITNWFFTPNIDPSIVSNTLII